MPGSRRMILTKKCDRCGKEFQIKVPRSQYCYKLRHKDHKLLYFCSDHCKREFEKEYIRPVIRPGSW